MAVGEICNRDVVIADKSLSVAAAAQLMRTHHVGDVVVVEEKDGRKHPAGIVTDRVSSWKWSRLASILTRSRFDVPPV